MNQFKKKPLHQITNITALIYSKNNFSATRFSAFFCEMALVDLDPDGLSATASGGKMNSSSSLTSAFFRVGSFRRKSFIKDIG